MKYRADIDGLRAVAVLGVVAFHAFPALVTGGFAGVDVFFVISGFLITGIILDQRDRGIFSIREFYARRVRRIFPALAVVLAATFGIGWAILFNDEFNLLSRQIAAGAGFAANILFWREAGYFDQSAALKPLLHLWSLGVEEQFYLAWPFLLMAFGASRKRLAWMFAIVFVASMAVNLHYVHHYREAVFYLPQFRFWEFIAGAAIVLVDEQRLAGRWPDRPVVRHFLSVAGLLMLAFAMFHFDSHLRYPGRWAAVPVLGAAMMIYAGPASWGNRMALSHPLMAGIGLISYPLYLWHWPLISFLHVLKVANPWILGASLEISLLLAWLTYTLLERPVRSQPAARIALALCAACFIVFLAGVAGFMNLAKPRLNFPELNNVITARNDWAYPPPHAAKADFDEADVYRLKGSIPGEVLYIGDSNIEQFAPRIDSVIRSGRPTYSAVFLTKGGCHPIPNVTKEPKDDVCPDLEPAILDYIGSHPVRRIIIGGRWNPGLFSPEVYYHFSKGDYMPLSDPRARKAAVESFRTFTATLRKHGMDVRIVQNIPSNFNGLETLDTDGARLTFLHDPRRAFAAFNPRIARAIAVDDAGRRIIADVATTTGAQLIDPIPHLCGDESCPLLYESNKYVYKDEGHLTADYAARYAGFIDDTVLAPR